MGRFRFLFGALLGFFVVSAMALPGFGGEVDDEVELTATSHVVVTQKGDWVHFDYSEPLGEVREFAYHGESVGSGGCSFSGEETAGGPDQPPGVVIEEREVATNLRDCIMRTERGVSPTLASTPEAGQFREDGASSRGVTSDLNAQQLRGKPGIEPSTKIPPAWM